MSPKKPPFFISARTAYRLHTEHGLGITKFSRKPLADHSAKWFLNPDSHLLYEITRKDKPSIQLTYLQALELLLLPSEAWYEYLRTI